MLKNAEIYQVEVALNDGQSMCCNLLSVPTTDALIAVADGTGAQTAIKEALVFVQEVSVPQVGEDAVTGIVVAGMTIGKISIVTAPAIIVTPKRGRKPKSAAAPAPEAMA
jgi:hypothetical protein